MPNHSDLTLELMASLSKTLSAYIQLMRLDRPIGIYLILWPTLWALWLAKEGLPDQKTLLIFVLGVVLMRSAGCVINDYADRHIDGKVKRTSTRPLASGILKPWQALTLFGTLLVLAFLLVLLTNTFTIILSGIAVTLAAAYPFVKRHSHLPQVVLGAAFAWAVPMAFAATTETLPDAVWLIYITVLLWTVTYDTFYGMVDRDDDIKIGVKSTAILFGDKDRIATACLQVLVVAGWVFIGRQFELTWIYNISVLLAILLFIYQQYLIRTRNRDACFAAFLNNNWVGLLIFIGIAGDYAFRAYI